MKILIVEDDHLQSELLTSQIQARFESAKSELIETELEFREALPRLAKSPPDVILMDIMLRWTNPSPNMVPAPQKISEEGFYNAGFRCQELLASNSKLCEIPIILFSVLNKFDLEEKLKHIPQNVVHLAKDNDISFLLSHLRLINSKIRR